MNYKKRDKNEWEHFCMQVDDFEYRYAEHVMNLNRLFDNLDIEFEIDDSNEKRIWIHYDPMSIQQHLSRHAGKPVYGSDITVKEVRERMDCGESAESIAESIGISRATFFRKLKYAEKYNQKLYWNHEKKRAPYGARFFFIIVRANSQSHLRILQTLHRHLNARPAASVLMVFQRRFRSHLR